MAWHLSIRRRTAGLGRARARTAGRAGEVAQHDQQRQKAGWLLTSAVNLKLLSGSRLLERGAGCEPIVLRSGKCLRILHARLGQHRGLCRILREKLS
jgi:hypothetical protein